MVRGDGAGIERCNGIFAKVRKMTTIFAKHDEFYQNVVNFLFDKLLGICG